MEREPSWQKIASVKRAAVPEPCRSSKALPGQRRFQTTRRSARASVPRPAARRSAKRPRGGRRRSFGRSCNGPNRDPSRIRDHHRPADRGWFGRRFLRQHPNRRRGRIGNDNAGDRFAANHPPWQARPSFRLNNKPTRGARCIRRASNQPRCPKATPRGSDRRSGRETISSTISADQDDNSNQPRSMIPVRLITSCTRDLHLVFAGRPFFSRFWSNEHEILMSRRGGRFSGV